jgi:hypothetical protein
MEPNFAEMKFSQLSTKNALFCFDMTKNLANTGILVFDWPI